MQAYSPRQRTMREEMQELRETLDDLLRHLEVAVAAPGGAQAAVLQARATLQFGIQLAALREEEADAQRQLAHKRPRLGLDAGCP